MAECEAVCEHAHLPLQSGSTRVLKAMRRTYSRERYLRLVDELRAAIPDLALTTDLIVGFPGETEEDFEETLTAVEEVGYDGAFTFVYSPRQGTEAAAMPDQVPEEIKRERIERLVDVGPARGRRAATASAWAASRRCSSRGRAAPTPRSCEDGHGAIRRSTSRAAQPPGELVDVRIEDASSATLRGAQLEAAAA